MGAVAGGGFAASVQEHSARPALTSVLLRARGATLRVARDGSFSWLRSEREGRLVFGTDALHFYKVQEGVRIRSGRLEWKQSLWPDAAVLSGRLFDGLDVKQSIAVRGGVCLSSLRRVSLSNTGKSTIRIRLISIHDPTAANSDGPGWGSIGVNAFSRPGHVAMDEVSDPGCRVVGSHPCPQLTYMTNDPTRATEAIQRGELPDTTAGMSGQIILMTQRETELQPGETSEFVFGSVYNSERLEEALEEFNRLTKDSGSSHLRAGIKSSESTLGQAASWATSVLLNSEFERDVLERCESLLGLSFIDPEAAKRSIESLLHLLRKDGALPHSSDRSRAGLLETSVFLSAASRFCILSTDRFPRSVYGPLRRAARYLLAESKNNLVSAPTDLPHGWRRRLGKGYPAGTLAELNLAVARALRDFASLAGRLNHGSDAAACRERAELIAEAVSRKLLDETGSLAVCLDTRGVLHREATIDQAVSLYRYRLAPGLCSSVVHRLLEKDFETGYGPRTVPTSNSVYFSGWYGDGQLGGYWTRGALAHTLLAYASGLPGIGSLELSRISRLVSSDVSQFGVAPGSIPYWINIEKRTAGSEESDPVAAARLLEAIIFGELGLSTDSGTLSFDPQTSSSINWILIEDTWLGERCTLFVGRQQGAKVVLVSSPARVKGGIAFQNCERVEHENLVVRLFHTPQSVLVCNPTPRTISSRVSFPPRDQSLLRQLSAWLEEADGSGGWKRLQQVRVLAQMAIQVSVGPNGWKLFRLSTS